MEHDLKCIAPYFEEVYDENKTAEMRFNDRGFQKGDTVKLNHWSKEGHCAIEPYQPIKILITHVLTGEQFGIKDGHCMFSFKIFEKPEWKRK
jgi:hypothetical protein